MKNTIEKQGLSARKKHSDRWFVNEDGVQCVETRWGDNEVLVLKISDPNDPFFQKIRDNLADIPPLDLHSEIDEKRNSDD